MTKAEARKYYLDKRLALNDAERNELDRTIHARVLQSEYFVNAETVHIFLSLERTREPDTRKLLDQNKKFIIPRINESGTLDHFYYEGMHQLKQNRLGILEPTHGTRASIEEIDFVLAPLAAFDTEGNRVGYGKGYYDKFLKDCRPDCIIAGLSFFAAAQPFNDVEPHDIPLDLCFTPERVYEF